MDWLLVTSGVALVLLVWLIVLASRSLGALEAWRHELRVLYGEVHRLAPLVTMAAETRESQMSTVIEEVLAFRKMVSLGGDEINGAIQRATTQLVEVRDLLDAKVPRLMEVPIPSSVPAVVPPEERPVTWADLRKAGEARRRAETARARFEEQQAALKEKVKHGVAPNLRDTLETEPLVTLPNPPDDVRENSNRRATRMDDILKAAREIEADE